MSNAGILKLNESPVEIVTGLLRLWRLMSGEQKAALAAALVATEAELCVVLAQLAQIEPR